MVRARLAVDAAPARVPPGLTAQSPAGVWGGALPSGGDTREYTARQGHAERSPGGGRGWAAAISRTAGWGVAGRR
ncbi:MAG TPA: hypothetical protein VGJ50_10435 [Streptosporangiaceae bacterium]